MPSIGAIFFSRPTKVRVFTIRPFADLPSRIEFQINLKPYDLGRQLNMFDDFSFLRKTLCRVVSNYCRQIVNEKLGGLGIFSDVIDKTALTASLAERGIPNWLKLRSGEPRTVENAASIICARTVDPWKVFEPVSYSFFKAVARSRENFLDDLEAQTSYLAEHIRINRQAQPRTAELFIMAAKLLCPRPDESENFFKKSAKKLFSRNQEAIDKLLEEIRTILKGR